MRECQLCKNCFTDDVNPCPNDGMPTIHTIDGDPVLEGKYHLECRLGQGGMGVVYKARHAYLKTLHAIKIILPDLVGNDPQLVTRFRQEALAAAAIRHQNVVGVSDYGVIDGKVPFLVMEYVEGESLHDLLTREKILSPEKAYDLMSAICAGVGAAHHQGIVHRDLKPLNIMICKDKPSMSQAVKILDFGLAKIKSGELLGSFIQAQTTGLMGSPYYMAPEQWADEEPDSRSDIYSLGVMLFQMLTGDVPFKGSSIPAIMKKHISDPPPTFTELGARIPLEIEMAVRHSLQKEKQKRTATVEDFVDELRQAIMPIGLHSASGGGTLPVSSLRVLTNPPESQVYVDSVPVGQTKNDGWLMLEGIQSGNHRLRISKPGFEDWQAEVICDGKPQQVVAELKEQGMMTVPAIPMPGSRQQGIPAPESRLEAIDDGLEKTRVSHPHMGNTGGGMTGGGTREILVDSQPVKRPFFTSPIVLGIAGVFLLFTLGAAGIFTAYMLGVFGGSKPPANTANSATPTPADSGVPKIKLETAAVPAGTFTMGRNDGTPAERPEHPVPVGAFSMGITEVTNAAYFEFVEDAKYSPGSDHCAHWVNGRPIAGQEQMPVRFVNMEDVKAFIAWRSKKEKVNYRLPTEQEWEYAARNGGKNNLYPWGDKYEAKCAVLEAAKNEPQAVGTKPCPNDWGIQDLIGNVFEWTSSEAALYPGNPGTAKQLTEPHFMIRGGSFFQKSTGPNAITSTYRIDIPGSKRSPELGFRLVSSQ